MTLESTDVLGAAIRSLSFAWEDGDRRMVSLPVQYPSGALVTLEVGLGRREAHVSDRGAGYLEAFTLCSDTSFTRFANAEANRRGIVYDDGAFSVRKVDLGMLPAALVAVANASATTAISAIKADSERKDEARRDTIFDRVRLAFPNAHVHREAELAGGRALWGVHNVVDLHDNRKAIFEPVSTHVLSVATKYTMFSDLISRGDLVLNAVFADPSSLDAKAQMLREVANIVGVEDSLETYRAKAA